MKLVLYFDDETHKNNEMNVQTERHQKSLPCGPMMSLKVFPCITTGG